MSVLKRYNTLTGQWDPILIGASAYQVAVANGFVGDAAAWLASLRGSLPAVTITDAAVSMLPNTRYQGSIAAFTADRTYTLPAGTAGDVIEIALTTGDDAFELIIAGASGVSINGGSAATEWSRLFINNEFVRFRCFATNDWRVEVDGRIAQDSERTPSAGVSIANDAWNTVVNFATIRRDVGNIATPTGKFTVRRSGLYRVSIDFRLSTNSSSFLSFGSGHWYLQSLVTSGGTIFNGAGVLSKTAFAGSAPPVNVFPYSDGSQDITLAAGTVIELNVYRNTQAAEAAWIVPTANHFFSIRELL